MNTDEAPVPAPEDQSSVHTAPWLMPATAVLVVLMTGLIWGTVL
jgi:hypothetical protein